MQRWALSIGLVCLSSCGLFLVQGCSDDTPIADDAGADPDTGGSSGSSGDASTNGDGDPDAAPSGPPAVRFVGRFDTSDPVGPRVNWPGARIIYRFSGSSLTVKLTEVEGTDTSNVPSRYDVIIDGQVQSAPIVPKAGDNDITVASNLGDGVHVVELWRRTETYIGVTQFRGYQIGGGGQLFAPPLPAPHRIEIVGDSASNGYGVECASDSEQFSGATQNERKAYPAIMAKALNAEYINVSWSGKGVLRNYDSGDTEMFGYGVSPLYLRSLGEDPASKWTFPTSWVPDLIWIGLASNDFSSDEPVRPAPDLAAFKSRYHELVTLIRQKNPNAQILCTVAGALNDAYPPGYDAYTNVSTILKAIVNERHGGSFNDPRVHYFELPRADGSGPNGNPDLSGCSGHSSAAYHQKLGTAAAAHIKTLMGW